MKKTDRRNFEKTATKVFEKADKRDKGFVSKSKFYVCLAKLDIEMEEDMADALCAKFDFRGVGVQYTDFINFCVEDIMDASQSKRARDSSDASSDSEFDEDEQSSKSRKRKS